MDINVISFGSTFTNKSLKFLTGIEKKQIGIRDTFEDLLLVRLVEMMRNMAKVCLE